MDMNNNGPMMDEDWQRRSDQYGEYLCWLSENQDRLRRREKLKDGLILCGCFLMAAIFIFQVVALIYFGDDGCEYVETGASSSMALYCPD
jgi:hypothetical protein